ncbi:MULTISPECIES: Ku protein [Cryobacterium]|uniref:Non-homologous end joining protein Ku n=1 Tax=Cryobacterium breve TaxID=1259258 RepID=A0ABY2IYK1_9MICO|nr:MULTISPECIES: Ku protein [Cryobacterium]TFC96643.1 Ku protein [Cryobacterium sp. TmT3-12]TFC97560.1 Ku protein [Cryobacterium breve]
MRSIWKGAITFGLVNVPVKVYSATEDHDVALHQVHDADGGRIRYQRRCERCGRVVDYAHIDKAWDSGDKTVVITDDDVRTLPAERSREIEVVEFVPSDQLDPIMYERSYFLEPFGPPKAYVLLRRALEATDRTAIVRFALRQKTRLGALRVRGDVLLLQSLLWGDEVRAVEFPVLEESVRISAQELELSSALVDSFAADFSPQDFRDDYQDQLRELLEAKLAAGATVDAVDTELSLGRQPGEAEGGGGEVLDLMEALRRSVERSRGKAESNATEKPDKPAVKGRKRASGR